MEYKDYYKILGISRNADAAEIKKVYRRLARKHHPDVNRSPDAEAKFKEVAEAYAVLRDPEKRRRFDELGRNWRHGQGFQTPPGWQKVRFEQARPDPNGFGSHFSDFFETLFGGTRSSGRQQSGQKFRRAAPAQRGRDHETRITISLEDAYRGANREIRLEHTEHGPGGRPRKRARTYRVDIPAGTTDGARIRLGGQGERGTGGGSAGDLYIRISVAPHARYRVHGRDLETDLPLAPWEAALGATVNIPAVDGAATVRVPAGTQSGKRIRLKGKGLPGRSGRTVGHLYAVVRIVVPEKLSPKEKELFKALAAASAFAPRQC